MPTSFFRYVSIVPLDHARVVRVDADRGEDFPVTAPVVHERTTKRNGWTPKPASRAPDQLRKT